LCGIKRFENVFPPTQIVVTGFSVQKTTVSEGNMCAAIDAGKSRRECTVVDGIRADPGKDDAVI
jgi:hypothetical protein